jgi:hypothetical protein
MSSDDSNDDESNRSFDQSRKGATTVCNPQIRSLLSDWYGVPEDDLVHVEGAKDGEYAPGVNDVVDRLDYCGVDWLVPKDGKLIPVGERLRTGERGEWRDMTLRTRNGTDNPSEGQTIPEAIEGSGVYPRDYVLAVREQWDVHRAVLLDTAAVIERAESPTVKTGHASNDDGSAYRWFRLPDLLMQGCHREVWCQ